MLYDLGDEIMKLLLYEMKIKWSNKMTHVYDALEQHFEKINC